MSAFQKKGMRALAYALGLGGAYALYRSAGPVAVVGVILLIWSNNVYEATKAGD